MRKIKNLSIREADAEEDIELINRYSVKELGPEDVFCFSVALCDNDVDRDMERFTDATLEELAGLFVGKTGISDHVWSAGNQVARLYRAEVQETTEKNRLGEPLKKLVGSAYMLRTEHTQPLIDAIEGGIVKEVSVGCALETRACSICGTPFAMNWSTWEYECQEHHVKGESYDGELCVCELSDATDAYEFSFVAVPAQRGAGVTKSAEGPEGAIAVLMSADLSRHGDELRALFAPHPVRPGGRGGAGGKGKDPCRKRRDQKTIQKG